MRARILSAIVLFVLVAQNCSDDEAPETTVQAQATTSSATTASAGLGGAGGSAEPCFDYATFTATPAVSFANDVMPVFAEHCNSATCHGNITAPDGKLYLGRARMNDDATLDTVHANLVDVAATRAPAMKCVAPGDAEHSFLMIKLDGDFTCPQVECSMLGCGVKMPHGASKPKLDIEVRNRIRSWIDNGAPRSDTSAGGAGGMGGAAGAGG